MTESGYNQSHFCQRIVFSVSKLMDFGTNNICAGIFPSVNCAYFYCDKNTNALFPSVS